ncbi:alanine racemase [Glutamicibacter sp.]|uniref:alanine racemase n=1 Tax=Glutamicibacter sp. TaxID=1931995 RepID=UPI0028BD6885|nr:alanine racemase [Glutamicibacter sp.]
MSTAAHERELPSTLSIPDGNTSSSPVPQRSALIDLDAISQNIVTIRRLAGSALVMAVLKADGYGHGLVPAAQAALRGGADYLGTAVLEEAFELRRAGITAPIFSWLSAPGSDYEGAIREDIDVAAYDVPQLAEICRAAGKVRRPAKIHLKIDTGMWRGGATAEQWPMLCSAARRAQADGLIEVTGIWSHLASADEPGNPSLFEQLAAFRVALAVAMDHGIRPKLRHIANSAATLNCPEAHFDMVRPGLAVYGVNPLPQQYQTAQMQLRPAMTLCASVAHVKPAPAGAAVSYGGTERTTTPTNLAIIPLGYADGVMRSASSRGPVQIGDGRYRVIGRICMDQFIVPIGQDPIVAGQQAILFGPGDRGEPHVQEWADAAGTIPYEILTRIGSRVPRVYGQPER